MRYNKSLVVLTFVLMALLAGSAFAGWTTYGSQPTIKGSGKLTTEERKVENFDRIETYLGAELKIKIGSPQKLTVMVDDNLHDAVRTEVHGSTLIIDSDKSWSSREGCKIEITVPKLEEIEEYGSGYIEVSGLNGGLFSFDLDGSGNFWADGSVDELDVSINGSGNVDTRDLQAKEVYVTINGSGNAEVTALESIDGRVNGSGDITYYGKPEDVSRHVSGSGRIRAR